MMKLPLLLLGISLSVTITTTVAIKKSGAQLLDVKPWHGSYPEMNDSYPLSFIAFKGWLFPVPHVFVRTVPTHYYVEVGALPVTDTGELAGRTQTGLLRIAAKLLEREQMKGRHDETLQIRDQTELRRVISQYLFDARKDELPDIYDLAGQLITLYRKIGRFDQVANAAEIKQILQEEADGLLMRFLMVNLMETDHGSRLESLAHLRTGLRHLTGETDYTYRKLCHFDVFGREATGRYAFLTN